MEVVKVTSETFETEVLKSKEPVLIDFFADWCGPCKMLSPIVDEIAQESEDIKVVKINVDESPDIAPVDTLVDMLTFALLYLLIIIIVRIFQLISFLPSLACNRYSSHSQ